MQQEVIKEVNYVNLSGKAIKALDAVHDCGQTEAGMVLLDEFAKKDKIMHSMGRLISHIHEKVGDMLYDLEVEDRMDEEIYKVLDGIYMTIEDAVIEEEEQARW